MTIIQIITRIFFTLVSASAFTLLGSIIASLAISAGNEPEMGWDRLADFLSWAFVSLLIGLIASAVMAFKQKQKQIVKGKRSPPLQLPPHEEGEFLNFPP
ncbi:MAG TPA: hypothetical protein G4N96_13070 [Chloroflexi bacterium]|nr:hypothetical protein [Chloroflexota bacterium]